MPDLAPLPSNRPAVFHLPDHNDDRTEINALRARAATLESGLAATHFSTPALRFTRLSDWADNRDGHNAIANNSTPWTLGPEIGSNIEIGIYWRYTEHAVIEYRTLPSQDFTRHVCTETSFTNIIESPTHVPPGGGTPIRDSHDQLTLAVDLNGYIHVAGNGHALPLKYVRSTLTLAQLMAGGTWAWTNADMVVAGGKSASSAAKKAGQENWVTYPGFYRNPEDGTLFFFYRDGFSGSGHWCCNRYNHNTQTWTRFGGTHFLNGVVAQPDHDITGSTAGDESAYDHRFKWKPGGELSIFWSWRMTTDPQHSDPSYVCLTGMTAGGTMAAKNADGTARTLPLSRGNIETFASRGTVIQGGGSTVDHLGHPHMSTIHMDIGDGTSQYEHWWYDGAAWQHQYVSNFDHLIDFTTWAASTPSWGTTTPGVNDGGNNWGGGYSYPISRPTIFQAGTRTYFVYRSAWDGLRDGLWVVDCTPGSPLIRFPITGINSYDMELVFNHRAEDERGQLHMWLSPTFADDNAPGVSAFDIPHFEGAENWQYQWCGILEIDPLQMDRLAAGLVGVPCMELISTKDYDPGSGFGNVSVASATHTFSVGRCMITERLSGQLLFGAFSCRMSLSNNTTVGRMLMQVAIGGVLGEYGMVVHGGAQRGTGSVLHTTPIFPLINTTLGQGDKVDVGTGWANLAMYRTAGAGTVTVDMQSMSIFKMSYKLPSQLYQRVTGP